MKCIYPDCNRDTIQYSSYCDEHDAIVSNMEY